jgi:hypothetical protein
MVIVKHRWWRHSMRVCGNRLQRRNVCIRPKPIRGANMLSFKPDLLGFPGIGVFAWPRDHEVRIIWYQSLAPLIRLYPSEIFVSCWFRKNCFVSNFFFSLNLRHIKKIVISFCYCSKYISSIKNKKKREKRKAKKNCSKRRLLVSIAENW